MRYTPTTVLGWCCKQQQHPHPAIQTHHVWLPRGSEVVQVDVVGCHSPSRTLQAHDSHTRQSVLAPYTKSPGLNRATAQSNSRRQSHITHHPDCLHNSGRRHAHLHACKPAGIQPTVGWQRIGWSPKAQAGLQALVNLEKQGSSSSSRVNASRCRRCWGLDVCSYSGA